VSRKPERIQGTDGVRGLVAPSARFSKDPLTVFLEDAFLTEEFFELYCYCHVKNLLERGLMSEGAEVPIGWDSRDVEGFYTSRAVSGISKAGGKPLLPGSLPTPAVPLLLAARGAPTGFMITASHNPADQNGIKIFLAPDGMKMLPEDDDRLTAELFAADYEAVKRLSEKHKPVDIGGPARSLMVDFHIDPRNSWFTGTPPDDFVLILDTARGATAGIAPEVFQRVGFGKVIQVAGEQNGRINENSGVALLEGIKEITDTSGSDHLLVGKIWEESRDEECGEGKTVFGVAFDGDGDRFYLLVYNPHTDSINILSGDECAALQARFLIETDPGKYRGSLFVHSVESDINLSRHAKSLGYRPKITGVGDKWILQEAVASPERFGLGCEETGHSIHAGYLKKNDGSERTVYAGNGIKGALNTLASVAMLAVCGRDEKFFSGLANPFPAGYKKSAYAYYVKKSFFKMESDVWKEAEQCIKKCFDSFAPAGVALASEPVDTEPDMLFFRLNDPSGTTAGSVFVRNSGTEDKISVNVRGMVSLKDTLDAICEETALLLMRRMKNRENRMATAEAEILRMIKAGVSFAEIDFEDVNFPRLLSEMEIKEKVIRKNGESYELTELGARFIG
jgi:phosphomannomutase